MSEEGKGDFLLWVYPKTDPAELPALVLAYIGDAVLELYVRTALVNKGLSKVQKLHKEASNQVRATSQARYLHELEHLLTPEETAVVKRGRNAKSGHAPKNTDVLDYRLSTGFEALFGHLFLTKNEKRIGELLEYLLKNNSPV